MTKLLNKKGFTLIELMVVIVIVGILAAVAIPKFTMASHKAKCSEFPTVLMSIYTAEGTYEQELGSYTSATDQASFEVIGLDDPSTASKNFNYDATGATSQFTAQAITKVAIGTAPTGATAQINQAQAKTGHSSLTTYVKTWN